MLEPNDPHLLVNGVEILMFAFRPVGVYLHFTFQLQYVENRRKPVHESACGKPTVMGKYEVEFKPVHSRPHQLYSYPDSVFVWGNI